MEQPKALAMVICDEVIEDKRTHKKTLVGLFNRIASRTFPARHPKMHVFFALTNGRGKYKAVLQQTHLQELKVLNEIQAEVEFNDPTAVFEYDFELVNLAFPYEGKYSFQLLLDGNPIVERILQVTKT